MLELFYYFYQPIVIFSCVDFLRQGCEGADEEEVAGWDLLSSDEEKRRREKFDALLRLQREHSGLIEPKKDLVVPPGMFLPERASPASGGDSGEPSSTGGPAGEPPASGGAADGAGKPAEGGAGARPRRGRAHRKQHPGGQSSRRQWIKREASSDHHY